MNRCWVLLFLLATLLPCRARANDAQFANYGGDVVPVENAQIRMLSEDIVFAAQSRGWNVTASYAFKNTEAVAQTITVGYPEIIADSDLGDTSFRKLEIEVDGKSTPYRSARTLPGHRQPWKGHPLGRVHLFEVSFPPKREVRVVHRFAMGVSSSVAIFPEESLTYITQTGRLWKGTIGHARFTVEARAPVPDLVAWPRSYRLQKKEHFLSKAGEARLRLVYEMKDWIPTEDFNLHFMRDQGVNQHITSYLLGESCPDDELILEAESGKNEARELIQSTYGTELLRMCRNRIYARYGRPFSTPDLTAAFYEKSPPARYPPSRAIPESLQHQIRQVPVTSFIYFSDPAYDTRMLTAHEKRLILALRNAEAGWKGATTSKAALANRSAPAGSANLPKEQPSPTRSHSLRRSEVRADNSNDSTSHPSSNGEQATSDGKPSSSCGSCSLQSSRAPLPLLGFALLAGAMAARHVRAVGCEVSVTRGKVQRRFCRALELNQLDRARLRLRQAAAFACARWLRAAQTLWLWMGCPAPRTAWRWLRAAPSLPDPSSRAELLADD